MHPKIVRTLLIVLTIAAFACNMPGTDAATSPAGDITDLQLTQTAISQQMTQLAAPGSTATTGPGPVSEEATATFTLTPTETVTPTFTLTPIPCNRASFGSDVNYPDKTKVPAGTNFTKTWSLINNGSCAWNSAYSVVFVDGDRMGAPDATPVTNGTIEPGASANVSVNLKAPNDPGTYKGLFKLRASDGSLFGINADGQGAFWVQIKVPEPEPPAQEGKPNLKVTAYTLTPNPPIQGQVVTISISVYNDGDKAAGAFTVQWWSSVSASDPRCSWDLPSMAAHGGRVLTCTYTYPSWYAKITTRIVVDSGGTVNESNEGDNVFDTQISVSKP
jgi:hypothetical protein